MHKPVVPRATVRDLRNKFADISAWVEAGREVEITRRGRVIAKLVPAGPPRPRVKWDMEARMKKLKEIYGGKTLPGNSVLLMREGKDW